MNSALKSPNKSRALAPKFRAVGGITLMEPGRTFRAVLQFDLDDATRSCSPIEFDFPDCAWLHSQIEFAHYT